MNSKQSPKFTDLDMEAALCAWEYLIEQRDAPAFKHLFHLHGTGTMRQAAIHAGNIAQAVYEHMEAMNITFMEAYDWTFVPAVLDRLDWPKLIQHRLYAGQAYNPDLKAIFEQIIEAIPAEFYRETPKEIWMRAVNVEAVKQWQYPNFMSDFHDRAEIAFHNGDDPDDFVTFIGEKYALIPTDIWNT